MELQRKATLRDLPPICYLLPIPKVLPTLRLPDRQDILVEFSDVEYDRPAKHEWGTTTSWPSGEKVTALIKPK